VNYKEASKGIASLKMEVEQKKAIVELVESTASSMTSLSNIESAIAAKTKELVECGDRVKIAQGEVLTAQEEALMQKAQVNGDIYKNKESAKAEMDAMQDNVAVITEECNTEILRLQALVATALKDSDRAIAEASERESDANTKADQAEAALRRIGKLTGGVT
jgi:hypothetical protein